MTEESVNPFATEEGIQEIVDKCNTILVEHPGNRCCKYLIAYVKTDEFKGLSESGKCNKWASSITSTTLTLWISQHDESFRSGNTLEVRQDWNR